MTDRQITNKHGEMNMTEYIDDAALTSNKSPLEEIEDRLLEAGERLAKAHARLELSINSLIGHQPEADIPKGPSIDVAPGDYIGRLMLQANKMVSGIVALDAELDRLNGIL